MHISDSIVCIAAADGVYVATSHARKWIASLDELRTIADSDERVMIDRLADCVQCGLNNILNTTVAADQVQS